MSIEKCKLYWVPPVYSVQRTSMKRVGIGKFEVAQVKKDEGPIIYLKDD